MNLLKDMNPMMISKKLSMFFMLSLLVLNSDLIANEGMIVEEAQPLVASSWDWVIIGAVALLVMWAISMLIKSVNIILRRREIEIYQKHGLEEYLAALERDEGSFFHNLKRLMDDSVPLEEENDILLNHNYDGIKELDNNLPPWWLYGFYFTIVFGVCYMFYFHVFNLGNSSHEQYAINMKKAEVQVQEYLDKQSNLVDENNVMMLTSEEDLAAGKELFTLNCVACHLESGGGSPTSVGPNLTDEYWIHGGGIKNIFKTVKYGVPEKGMIAWQDQMRPSDIHKVASYIWSLQGSNPPNAKKAEGEIYTPATEEPIQKDSTSTEIIE